LAQNPARHRRRRGHRHCRHHGAAGVTPHGDRMRGSRLESLGACGRLALIAAIEITNIGIRFKIRVAIKVAIKVAIEVAIEVMSEAYGAFFYFFFR
jgi:hypothetical protein